MEQLGQEVNFLGYPVFKQYTSHYGCIYAGSKLVVLTLDVKPEEVRLDLRWTVPNLRELSTLRADETVPAAMKFAFRCGDLVLVDFVLRPKFIMNSDIKEHWLIFTARVKSQDSPPIFKDMDVFIVVRGELEDIKRSSLDGAVFRNSYSCQIPLFPISDLFEECSDHPIVRQHNDIDLTICIKLKMEDEQIEQIEEPEQPELEKYSEIMTMLDDSEHGDFIITGKDTCYYVHREKVEKHPLFLNIRQLHPQETEVDLESWDQQKLEMLLYEIYSSRNDEELQRISQHQF